MTPPTTGPESTAAALALPVVHVRVVASYTDRRLTSVRPALIPVPRLADPQPVPAAATSLAA
jgi:hypothetical protein